MTVVDLSSEQLIAALRLPAEATVGQRVPKKMLAENLTSRGTVTSADRKLLQDQIDEITWVAALKPSNAGIPVYQDEVRSYLELAVLCVRLRQGSQLDAKTAKVSPSVARLAELVHRAIPYPVLLVLDDGTRIYLSLVHIRWVQKEADKAVLDGELIQGILSCNREVIAAKDSENISAFLAALDLSKQPRSDLFSLYQGWMDTVISLQTAFVTGAFVASASREHAEERHQGLLELKRLKTEIGRLRSMAQKEHQLARQVGINLEIKRIQGQLEVTLGKL
jgi:hypothetical protein